MQNNWNEISNTVCKPQIKDIFQVTVFEIRSFEVPHVKQRRMWPKIARYVVFYKRNNINFTESLKSLLKNW